MNNKKVKKYRLTIWLSLLFITLFSIIFIGVYSINNGKLIFLILYVIILLICLLLDFRIKKNKQKDRLTQLNFIPIALLTLSLGTLNNPKTCRMVGLIAHAMPTFVCKFS